MKGKMIMNTKEQAYRIIDRLDDEQLTGFVSLFSMVLNDIESEQVKRDIAFENLQKLRKNVQNFDDKKALAEYREEKYGK